MSFYNTVFKSDLFERKKKEFNGNRIFILQYCWVVCRNDRYGYDRKGVNGDFKE